MDSNQSVEKDILLAGTLKTGLNRIDLKGTRVLLIIPDSTRTVPTGWFFKIIHGELSPRVCSLDVLIALGTHRPMIEEEINRHLGITAEERRTRYKEVAIYNHHWDRPDELTPLGTIEEEEIERISEGRLRESVEITVNSRALQYDHIIILSPVFPHELVGLSGGYKYLFPGISGFPIIDVTHWLAALKGNLESIGCLSTPMRELIHRAARLFPVPSTAVCTVINDGEIDGIYVGDVVEAWEQAAAHSRRVHIVRKPHPFHSVLAQTPRMYEDMWTGGKSIYKLEPIVEEGGELIVYAPHITSLSSTHEKHLLQCGYHCIDYFIEHMAKFREVPRMIMGVASYIYGKGTYAEGRERPRMNVKLATGISEKVCRKVGLGFVDHTTINPEHWKEREDEGYLFVEKAGETLYRL